MMVQLASTYPGRKVLFDDADFAKGTRSGEGGESEDLKCLRTAANRMLIYLVQHVL